MPTTEAIRIAHLSDLHFGMRNQDVVWRSLVDYLLRDPKPHAIVATGDLVDTPDPELLGKAAEEFRRFTQARISWTVTPGNHDRHGRGNAGWLGRMAAALQRRSTVGTAFDTAFSGHVATLENPVRWPPENSTFADARSQWRIRVIGIDSSIDARYSAQGFVPLGQFGRLAEQTQTSDDLEDSYDLLIALIHHHLLPIAALEKSAQTARGLLSPTVLVNAGTVLEALSGNNVNLVLHGHEHCRNVARFGVLGRSRASDVIVLGAGSATGAHTTAGCDASRASFNLLELRPDASVWVREARIVSGQWTADSQDVCLIDGRGVREGRVLRRRSIKERPHARIDRHFTIEEFRDIEVRESRTHWPARDGRLIFEANRPSGSPVLEQLRVNWQGGASREWSHGAGEGQASFVPRRGGGRGFVLEVDVDDAERMAQRLEIEYRWARSAVLTGTDINQLASHQVDFFRLQNRESVSIHVPEPLDGITLAVTIPPAYTPRSGTWKVFVGRPGPGRETIEENPELQSFVNVMPGGTAMLSVPFPLPDYRYYLSWPVRAAFPSDAGVMATRRMAAEQGNAWTKAITDRVRSLIDQRSFSATLYVPEFGGEITVRFRVCGFANVARDDGPSGMPRPVDIYQPRTEFDGLLGAWYGEASWAVADPDEPADPDEIWTGEDMVLLLPAYHVAWTRGQEPWGIVRLGFAAGEPISDALAERIAMAATIVI